MAMQVLYISNRPQVMRETWDHVRHFMADVDHAVVVAPAARHTEFGFGPDDGVTLVDDEKISGCTLSELAAMDHVSRNIRLRTGLLTSGLVDDRFLLSDDDYRPLKPIGPEFFVVDGRQVGYYCYDLAIWPGDETDFDRAQHVTHQALTYLGADHLCYGSHQPQVMDRDLLGECLETFSRLSGGSIVDEWSLYFNLGRQLDPGRFAEPRPFETICWPQYPNEWPWWVRPPAYSFENFYPELYQPRHLFAGIPTALDPEAAEHHAFEKILRWSEFGRHSAQLDFPTDVANPWTKDSAGRRVTFGVLKRLRKAYAYLSLDERAKLAELSGSVQRLEDELRRERAAQPPASED